MKNYETEGNTVDGILRDRNARAYLAFLSLHSGPELSDELFGNAVYLDIDKKGDQVFDYYFKLMIKKYKLVADSMTSLSPLYLKQAMEILEDCGTLDCVTRLVRRYDLDAKELSLFKDVFRDQAFLYDVILFEDWWLRLSTGRKIDPDTGKSYTPMPESNETVDKSNLSGLAHALEFKYGENRQ